MATAAQTTTQPGAERNVLPTGHADLPFLDHFRGGEAGTRWRFDVDAYYKMAAAGILMEDDRVELIDGDIVVMSPIGLSHAAITSRLDRIFQRVLFGRALVTMSNPIRFGQYSEPQPDVSILHPREDDYESARPTPADVYVLIEVMDTSASHDRGKKLALYAASGIPEVWLVDIPGELIEVCRGPVEGTYTQRRELKRGESLSPEAFPDAVIGVDAVLG